jgi:hypothetical protein
LPLRVVQWEKGGFLVIRNSPEKSLKDEVLIEVQHLLLKYEEWHAALEMRVSQLEDCIEALEAELENSLREIKEVS